MLKSLVAGWRWIVAALVLFLLVALLGWWGWREHARAVRAEQNLRVEVQRQAGEDRARRIGIPVVYQRPQAEVDAAAERAKKENPILRAQIEKAEKEIGKLRAELVAHLETEGAPAQAPVTKGDPLKLGGDLLVNRDDTGAHTLLGTLWAKKLDGTLVTEQPYSAPVTVAQGISDTTPPEAPGRWWRAGFVGGVTEDGPKDGWRGGLAASARLGKGPEVVFEAKAGPKRFEDGKRGVGGDLSIAVLF